MATTEDNTRATLALMQINATLDDFLPSVQEALREEDIVQVAGDLTVLLVSKGPVNALSLAVAAVLRLADRQ